MHRQRGIHDPGDLSHALAVAAGVLCVAPPERLGPYGDERAVAMTIRDTSAAAGRVTEAEWTAIDEHLRLSWRALRDSLAR